MMGRLAALVSGGPATVSALAVLAGLAVAGVYIKGRQDGAVIEAAQQVTRTEKVIHEISNVAERARAMRRLCNDRGLQYDPARIACAK